MQVDGSDADRPSLPMPSVNMAGAGGRWAGVCGNHGSSGEKKEPGVQLTLVFGGSAILEHLCWLGKVSTEIVGRTS